MAGHRGERGGLPARVMLGMLIVQDLAFGAFVADAVLGASAYSHQAFGDILPLRDLFGLLFFASVGMLLDPAFLWAHAGEVLVLVVLVALGRGGILALVTRLFGYAVPVAMTVGLGLFQVGELSFVLARQGLRLGVLSQDIFALLLTTAVVTMVLTPAGMALADAFAGRWQRRYPAPVPAAVNLPAAGLAGHVVIAGGGRVGQHLARALAAVEAPCVVVELDHRRLVQCGEAGRPVVYGDAANETVLRAVGIRTARLVAVTIPPPDVTSAIIAHARRVNPDLPVVVRAESIEEMHALGELGVTDVVQPDLEGSLAMVRHVLDHLALTAEAIDLVVATVRHDMAPPAAGAP